MTYETYEGWKNYPTWAVVLWLENEESTYKELRQLVRRSKNLKQNLKQWVTEMIDEMAAELPTSLVTDLLNYAVESIDWHEIAEHFQEDEDEEDEEDPIDLIEM